jgi:type 1 glutamine amidotransferase
MNFLPFACAITLAVSMINMPPAGAPREKPAAVIETPRVLVFSKTAGFRHDSIPDGISAVKEMGSKNSFEVDATEDAGVFTDDALSKYRVVIFLSTTGDVLDNPQQGAFERFVRRGGGFVGIHAATDTEYDWPWYTKLVGAQFASHPKIQPATIDVGDRTHVSTKHLPEKWKRTDEWYNFRDHPSEKAGGSLRILARLDESTYEGGSMKADHPVIWCQEFDGGRAWYTALGHTKESYAEREFLNMILGAIKWAGGLDMQSTLGK